MRMQSVECGVPGVIGQRAPPDRIHEFECSAAPSAHPSPEALPSAILAQRRGMLLGHHRDGDEMMLVMLETTRTIDEDS